LRYYGSKEGLMKHKKTQTHLNSYNKLQLPSNKKAFISFAICAKRIGVQEDICYAIGLWMRGPEMYQYTLTASNIMRISLFARTLRPVVPVVSFEQKDVSTIVATTHYTPEQFNLRLTEFYTSMICGEVWDTVRESLCYRVI
jgi:hypothetical protein